MAPSDGYQSSVGVMWHDSDLVECAIFLGLALMLAYTVFVTVRFFRRYFLARRESLSSYDDSAPTSERGKKNLVADLNRGAGALRSIPVAAPFLGLAGTCYGILCLFVRISNGKFSSTSAISFELSTALVATAAALIVAIPAAILYNILRTCLENYESGRSSMLVEANPRTYGFAQTLPLLGRFSGFPALALIAAPVLSLLIPMVALMLRSAVPVGLPVHIAKIGVNENDPIVVSVIDTGLGNLPAAYVNSEETPWNELGNTLRSQLKVRRPSWIVYIAGEDKVSWTYLANAIDVVRGLHAEVVLLTIKPTIDPSQLRKVKNGEKKHM